MKVELFNAHLEIRFNPDLWAKGCVVSIINGKEHHACPNGTDDLLDTFAHELAHHIVAQVTYGQDVPSQCVGAPQWDALRRYEEGKALAVGKQLAAAMRMYIKATEGNS